MQTNSRALQPTFSDETSGCSSSQNFLRRKWRQTLRSQQRWMRRKRKCREKMKASSPQKIMVRLIRLACSAYSPAKLTKLRNMNIFIPSVMQKCSRMYLRSQGSQYTASARQAACTADTPTIALRGCSQKTVSTRARRAFLRQLKNQKYLVTLLQLVRMRQRVGVKEWSLIHSGFTISSRAFRRSRTRTTSQRARKTAEKKGPTVAKLLLKVRFETCVKMLMLSSTREKQKKTINKLNQSILCSLVRNQNKSLLGVFYSFISKVSIYIQDWVFPIWAMLSSTGPMRLRTSQNCFLLLKWFLSHLTTSARAKMREKTMIQVNWLEKKFAVLPSSLYLPQMF